MYIFPSCRYVVYLGQMRCLLRSDALFFEVRYVACLGSIMICMYIFSPPADWLDIFPACRQLDIFPRLVR